jgi:hypothetical protein
VYFYTADLVYHSISTAADKCVTFGQACTLVLDKLDFFDLSILAKVALKLLFIDLRIEASNKKFIAKTLFGNV